MTAEEIIAFAITNRILIQKHQREGLFASNPVIKQTEKHVLNACYLHTLEKPSDLASLLNAFLFDVQNMINQPVYMHHVVPKKRGGFRDIYAPDKELKTAQKHLNYYLQAYYLLIKPRNIHGFVINPHYLGRRCNIVENAKVHTGKGHLLNIDIKDFFPSISAKRVKELFSSPLFNYDEQITWALTMLTTYKGLLPTGAPTSPVLSNFVCLELDKELKNYAQISNLQYSRYADDLTFSSDDRIHDDMILDIVSIINKNHFKINQKKLRLVGAHRRQTVTGITVNQKVNVDRKLLKRTRAMLHDLTKNGLYDATSKHFHMTADKDSALNVKFIRQLEGYINFIGQVRGRDDAVYLKLKTSYQSLFSFPVFRTFSRHPYKVL